MCMSLQPAFSLCSAEEARAQQRLLESERAEQEERARAALAEVAEARAGQEQQQRDLDELRQRLSGHDHQVHKREYSAPHSSGVSYCFSFMAKPGNQNIN